MMIISPLGQIKVYADGVCLEYQEISHRFDRHPVKDHPIEGCYRICVPTGKHHSIRCELELTDPTVLRTGDSGQAYLNAEFEKGTINLRIGAEDENQAFETVRTTRGVEYIIRTPIPEVVFGIAWAIDYEGSSDCRTWFAADPTLDK